MAEWTWTYLWPPRPEKAVPRSMLGFYERRGYVVQTKMNGTQNLLGVAPDRTLKCMSRHNEDHKAWKPTDASAMAFKDLPGTGWYVFVAELMHSKVPGLRDINYIHDILVSDGVSLDGQTFAARQALLWTLFGHEVKEKTSTHYVIDKNTWLARNYSGIKGQFDAAHFDDLYLSFNKPEIEGLVMKNPKAALQPCYHPSSNSDWQFKCRRATNKYSF
jgi:hypothetical protein